MMEQLWDRGEGRSGALNFWAERNTKASFGALWWREILNYDFGSSNNHNPELPKCLVGCLKIPGFGCLGFGQPRQQISGFSIAR